MGGRGLCLGNLDCESQTSSSKSPRSLVNQSPQEEADSSQDCSILFQNNENQNEKKKKRQERRQISPFLPKSLAASYHKDGAGLLSRSH